MFLLELLQFRKLLKVSLSEMDKCQGVIKLLSPTLGTTLAKLTATDDSPLTLTLHSLTKYFITSRFVSHTATARGDSPCLVTGAVVSEYK